MGSAVPGAEIRPPSPSQRISPWMLQLKFVPSISTPEISAAARIPGIQDTPSQMNMISSGRTRVPSTLSLNVYVHRKVTVGVAWMFSPGQHLSPAEMAHPTASPTRMAADFNSGAPNCSTSMTETNTLKPKPMSFGSPHGRGRGASMLRQRG
jgi:hypothetical protein